MRTRLHAYFPVILLILAGAAAGGCSGTAVVTSHLPTTPIEIDGSERDWQDAMHPVKGEEGLSLGVRNDGRDLYLAVIASNESLSRQIAARGLTFWFDAGGKREKRIGIRFPLGMTTGGPGARPVPEAWPVPGAREDGTALLALSSAGPEAYGQSRITLSGIVRDAETGEALPYAGVRLDDSTIGTATNVDGHFALVGVPAGEHTLHVTYLGYTPAAIELNTETFEGPIEVALSPAATELDEVTVTAEQYQIMKASETPSLVTVSPRDLVFLPSIGDVDIFRSLQLLPGISGTNEGSSGLYVRGGTPDQNLVLLDGMTVYHVDHFFGFFSAFNADAIKDVQVYKGGFPALYGGRTSSVVDLTGKTGANDYQLGVGVNLLSAGVVTEVPLGERASFLVSARRSYTDVLRTGIYNSIYSTLTGEEAAPPSGGTFGPGGGGGPGGRPGGGGALGGGFQAPGQATVQPDFYFYDLNAKLTYRPSNSDVVAVSFYNGQDNLDKSRYQTTSFTLNDETGVTTTNDILDVTEWGNLGLSSKWSRQWTPRFYSNALLAYSQYFSENARNTLMERLSENADTLTFSQSLGNQEDNRLDDVTFRLDTEWQATRSHKIGLGVQATHSAVHYTFTRNDSLSILDQEQQALHTAAYLQDTWKPWAWLSLNGGVRVAHYDVTTETFVEPRAAFNLRVTDRLMLKGAYGAYNQFVARVVNENVTEGARDFWLLADGENVGVQGATHYVLGASYETPGWLVDVEAYRKELTGLSEFSLRFQREGADFEASDLFFDGDGTARGIEFLVQKKSGRYTGWVSYTLARVEHTFAGLNGGEPFPALHDQRHEIKLVNSLRLGPRWNLATTWAFATGKPYTAPTAEYTLTLLDGNQQSYIHVGDKNGSRLPAYHRLDTALHYRFPVGTADVDLGLSIFNLYNHTNVWYKEFDLSQSPMVTTDVAFLGITPNLSLRVDL